MNRKLRDLTTNHFDLVIVGAGIHGATLALESAKAGYSVALIEQGDFGHSTSANSLKIIHGGIRYLQHGDLKRMRESIVSRRKMMCFAPHLVKPLACMMPTYGHGMKGRETMRLAFGLYDLVAWDRNRGLLQENSLPMGTRISPEEVRWVVPGINESGLTGGAVWYDAIAESTERLVLEYLLEARRYGAKVFNYVQAKSVKSLRGRVLGISACDLISGENLDISARLVVNAAGPWVEQLGERLEPMADQLWTTAVNIVVKKRLFKKFAVGLEGTSEYKDKDAIIRRGKRLFFFVPWQEDYTMIGTTYTPYRGTADSFRLGREDVESIVDEVNRTCPHAALKMEDVTFFHGGLLPMKEADTSQTDSVQLEKSSQIIDHGKSGGTIGLFSIKGVKYTTAPDIACKVLKLLKKDRHLPPTRPGCYQQERRPIQDLTPLITRMGKGFEPVRQLLARRYGQHWREVFAWFENDSSMNGDEPVLLSEKPILFQAELLHFIHREMARSLSDVVFRRSGLASSQCPDAETLSRVVGSMAGQFGWDEEESARQIEQVRDLFTILKQ